MEFPGRGGWETKVQFGVALCCYYVQDFDGQAQIPTFILDTWESVLSNTT